MISNKVLVSLNKVSLYRDKIKILDNVSMEIKHKEIVTMIGPNGAGKTSLLRIITGLYKDYSGEKFVKKGLKIGFMPQKIVIDKVMPLTVRRFLRLNNKNIKLRNIEVVKDVAKLVGILSLLDKQIHDISGGQMQQVLLARAILQKPDLLVLDEPAQSMDIQGQSEFYNLITRIKNTLNCSILLVSHDLHLVMSATDRVICLNKHICCHGCPEDVSKTSEFANLFDIDAVKNMAIYTHHHDHGHLPNGEIKKD